ncbi:tetratricopeptide repeat protein [Paenibacillus sp. strain BS8-2]
MTINEAISIRYDKIGRLIGWKRYKEAAAEAEALLRDEPEDAHAYALLALVYVHTENYDASLHWSGEALKRDPENTLAWFVRTNAYHDSGKLDKALETAVEGMRIDPYEPHYYFIRANINMKRGHHADAKALIESALEMRPNNATYIASLSYVEALLGDFASSRHHAREALKLDVESDSTFLILAWAAEQRGDYDENLDMLKEAIRIDPNDKQIRDAYLDGLQKNYKMYRILLAPFKVFKRMKPWQIFLTWIIIAIIFRPLIFIFIIVYALTHWLTKLLVHVKVFGWNFRR